MPTPGACAGSSWPASAPPSRTTAGIPRPGHGVSTAARCISPATPTRPGRRSRTPPGSARRRQVSACPTSATTSAASRAGTCPTTATSAGCSSARSHRSCGCTPTTGTGCPGSTAPQAPAEDFLRLREALVPYSYTLGWQAHQTGLPITHPLYLDYPEDDAAYNHPGEYL